MNRTIKHLLSLKAPMNLNKGAIESEIVQCENSLGNNLSLEYRRWLLYSNGGEIFVPGVKFYGTNALNVNSIVFQNSDKQRNLFSLPDTLIIIGRFNFGDLLCMDVNSGEIVQWDHELNEEFLRWRDFFTYLDEEIDNFVSEEQ